MKKKKVAPRTVPPRHDKYMGLAFWISRFSKDPSTQMGALIINGENRPLGWGYNGPPKEIRDTDINWDRPDKYDYVLHAERNAIRHSSECLRGSTLYVTGMPCKDCMLEIVSEGIRQVVYYPHITKDKKSSFSTGEIGEKTLEIARHGRVELIEFEGNLNWMRDDIMFMEEIGIFG